MSFELSIITDLAVLLVIGSAVAFIFHKFKQPLILGYLVAGVIIGPYSPPFSLIGHQNHPQPHKTKKEPKPKI